jgi:hypothetical protein
MPATPRLALPLIAAGQAQKDVTHNEAVLALDRLVALVVASRSLTVPPATPPSGACYIVPSAGGAAWGHPAGTLMYWQDSGWLAASPRDGQIVLLDDEEVMLVRHGDWQARWPTAGLTINGRTLLAATPAMIVPPSGGGTVDSEARATLTSLLTALQQQGIIS